MSSNTKKISLRKENLIKHIDNLPDKPKNFIYDKLAESDDLKELEQEKATGDRETVSGFKLIHFLYILFVAELQEKIEQRKNRSLTEEECFDLTLFIAGKFVSDISKTFEILDKEEKLILECFRRGMKLKDLQQFSTFKGRSLEQLSKDFFEAKAGFINCFALVSDLPFKDNAKVAEIMSIVVDGFAEDEFPADPILLKLLNFVVRPAEDDENRTKVREKIKLFLAYTYTDSVVRIDDLEEDYNQLLMAIDHLIKEKKIKCELPELSVYEKDPEEEKKQRDIVMEYARLYRLKVIFKGEIKGRFSDKFSRFSNEVVYKLEKLLVKTFGINRFKDRFRANQGETLIVASFLGDLRKVKRLIDDGADINFLGKNWNPLHAAIQGEEVEILKYLIEKGADLNFFWKDSSPLHSAIDTEARHLLLDEDSEGENKDFPQPVLTEILVKAGANINSFSSKFGTPLELAKRMEHKFAIELLERWSSS